MLTQALITEAVAALSGQVRHTPVEASPGLAARLGGPVWLKLECLQLGGSFKLRGALFRLGRLTAEERRLGVVTCSAGNHGIGVAYAAGRLGVRATVFVPRAIDPAKRAGIRALGAEVVESEHAGYDDTELEARRAAEHEGRPFISPFDDEAVMAGNGGSLAAEVLEQVPAARSFVLPVGGGGLAAGFSFLVEERAPGATVIGCQHRDSPGLALSLERGEAVTRLPAVETVAGGLEGGVGVRTFAVMRERITRVALASEEEIVAAMGWVFDHHHYLIEPSAAVTVACCLSGAVGSLEPPVVVVLSGRNVDGRLARRLLGVANAG